MFICLNQICGYTDLCHEVEQLRKEPYSSENTSHEKKLMQVKCAIMYKSLILLLLPTFPFLTVNMLSVLNGLFEKMANSLTHSLTHSLTPMLRCKLFLVILLTSA